MTKTATASKPNALLFGFGAIGGVYAHLLQASGGVNVSAVARSNYAALRENGYKLVSAKFGDHEHRLDGVYKDTKDAAASGKKFDYVLCANKAFLDSTPSLADTLRPVVSENTSIVLLQNGAGNEDPLHAAFPATTIISAVVWTGARVLPAENGVATLQQFASEALTIGVDYTPTSDRVADRAKLERLTGWLTSAGGDCTLTEDIQSERWIKLIWNCAWNALTTVTRMRTGHFFGSSPGAEEFSVKLMNEVAAVARAKGLKIPDGTPEALLAKCKAMGAPGLPSSMWMDSEAGRPMEVEVILGTPLREGKRLGVPVPILETLYTIVKALDWRNAHKEEVAAAEA